MGPRASFIAVAVCPKPSGQLALASVSPSGQLALLLARSPAMGDITPLIRAYHGNEDFKMQ